MKKLFSILFTAFLIFFPVAYTYAIAPLGFGGYVVFAIPCTCPPFGWNITYGIFYPALVNTLRTLYLPPTAIPYSYQTSIYPVPLPTSWELGSYIPGPGACLTGVPPCLPLPAGGTIVRVGASMPGFIPYLTN